MRTRGGATDMPHMNAAAHRIFGNEVSAVVDVSAEARGGADAIDVLTLALSIYAGLAALAGRGRGVDRALA